MANAAFIAELTELPADSAPRSIPARVADAPVLDLISQRWSSRAFSTEQIDFDTIRTLFEAARFAPSAGNSQPWVFVYAAERATRRRALPILKEENRRWASQAPLLVFVFAHRQHPQAGAPLRMSAFDTGAAWCALALQAQQLGLNCRAMGGIHHDLAHRILGVPEDRFEPLIAIAIGYPGSSADLPPDLAAKDVPTGRRRQGEFVYNGRYFERDA